MFTIPVVGVKNGVVHQNLLTITNPLSIEKTYRILSLYFAKTPDYLLLIVIKFLFPNRCACRNPGSSYTKRAQAPLFIRLQGSGKATHKTNNKLTPTDKKTSSKNFSQTPSTKYHFRRLKKERFRNLRFARLI